MSAAYQADREPDSSSGHEHPPKSVDIFADSGCAHAWDEEGSAIDLVDYWPQIPELADLRERLIAWSETLERRELGHAEVLEVYDINDKVGHSARGRAIAEELARLLAPEGVTVTYYGEHLAGSTVTEIRRRSPGVFRQ